MIKQVQGTPGLVHTFFLLPSFPFPFHSERIIPFDQSEARILSWWPIRSSWYSSLRHPWWHGPGSDAFFHISRVSRRGVAAWFAARCEAPDTGHSRVSSRASDWSGPTPRTSTIWRQFLQRTASVNKQLTTVSAVTLGQSDEGGFCKRISANTICPAPVWCFKSAYTLNSALS